MQEQRTRSRTQEAAVTSISDILCFCFFGQEYFIFIKEYIRLREFYACGNHESVSYNFQAILIGQSPNAPMLTKPHFLLTGVLMARVVDM